MVRGEEGKKGSEKKKDEERDRERG